MAARKVLMIGPYPPPEGGWSTAIREELEELENRGIKCRVLNLGVNRRKKSDKYICVYNSFDFLVKLLRYGFSGYLFRLHMNGDSHKGIALTKLIFHIGAICFSVPYGSWFLI
jgi:hypothetical protein